MNGIPDSRMMPALPSWQVEFLWAVLIFFALGVFTLLLWRVARGFRARRIVHCPITLVPAEVILRLDAATGEATDVVRCSLLDPPHDVNCSQSCLHLPAETLPHPRA